MAQRRSRRPTSRYVITLDCDTRLPRDTVRRLIGKMAHPLNRPRFDAETRRDRRRLWVMQPRVTPSLPIGREGSLFQRIFSSLSGIDPYASAVSDVYQDLFGEGSYAGKGIYDIDAFEFALAGRAPDSTLLSHDLFEGVFARAGLASDVEVVEEFPSRYDVERPAPSSLGARRLAAPALDSRFAGQRPPARREVQRHPGRRSLENARQSAPHALGARFDPRPSRRIAAAASCGSDLDRLRARDYRLAADHSGHRRDTAAPRRASRSSSHFRALGGDLKLALTLSALTIIFLADQAWLMADAIIRTLYRLSVSRRASARMGSRRAGGRGRRLDLPGFYRRMPGALAIGARGADHGLWSVAAESRCCRRRSRSPLAGLSRRRARRQLAAGHRQQGAIVRAPTRRPCA